MILSAYHNRSVKIHWNAVLMGRKASPLFSLFENRGAYLCEWDAD